MSPYGAHCASLLGYGAAPFVRCERHGSNRKKTDLMPYRRMVAFHNLHVPFGTCDRNTHYKRVLINFAFSHIIGIFIIQIWLPLHVVNVRLGNDSRRIAIERKETF